MNISSGKILSAQKVVVYGPEGIGKSTFAAQFPDPLFIDTEGSTKHIDVRRFDKPSSWQMLLEQVRYVINTKKLCGTLIIDTADWAELLCTNDVLARYKKSGVEDFGYGKGYVYVAEEFGRLLNLLEEVISSGVNVVLTAHAKLNKFEQPDEMGSYDRWEMKLSKQVRPLVKEWADMILFANYKTIVVKDGTGDNAKAKAQGGRRMMYTAHHPCWDAKNRHGLADELSFDYKEIAPCIPNMNTASSAPAAATTDPPKTSTDTAPTVEQAAPPITVSDKLPKALRDLMIEYQVTEQEIQLVVANFGYFPIETPIENYGDDFINGALIAGWSQLYPKIVSNRDLPFD